MFIDDKKEPLGYVNQSNQPVKQSVNRAPTPVNRAIIWGAVALVVLLVPLAGVLVWLKLQAPVKPISQPQTIVTTTAEQATSTFVSLALPKIAELTDLNDEDVDKIKAEKIYFGDNYNALFVKAAASKAASTPYKLPLNVKTDTVNYYDLARKLNLDPALSDLNKQGFAIVDSPLTATNFFNGYQEMANQAYPILVTDDFIVYHYQQRLKELYQNLQDSIFYQNYWYVARQLFDLSSQRYATKLLKNGATSDPSLESQRLEAAYLAVALELLKPQDRQISPEKRNSNPDKFSPSEAAYYDFNLPDYLAEQVNAEVALIRNAGQTVKSPVLLYQRDYREFAVPENLARDSRQVNFYLASRWLNSLFPQYYKSLACPNCALDKNDWLISQGAAVSLASDLVNDQKLINRWARVYKLMSFFDGSPSELTSLDLVAAWSKQFGKQDAATVFSINNSARETDLASWQRVLTQINYPPINGWQDRSQKNNLPTVGWRLLLPQFWPSSYIWQNLMLNNVGKYNGDWQKTLPFTACSGEQSAYRCRGFGYDLAGLVSNQPVGSYYRDNLNFANYQKQASSLKTAIAKLDQAQQHKTIFWHQLNLLDYQLINPSLGSLPTVSKTNWTARNVNSGLGWLTSWQLPADKLTLNLQNQSGLEATTAKNDIYYVEANPQLIAELTANVVMINKTLLALGIIKQSDPSLLALQEQLTTLAKIVDQERANQKLDSASNRWLESFIVRYQAEKSNSPMAITTAFGNKNLTQSIKGLKLLVMVKQQAGQKALVVGPVFNYTEY